MVDKLVPIKEVYKEGHGLPLEEIATAAKVAAADENIPDIPPEKLPYTRGEAVYDAMQFTIGKAAIMVATAAIVFVARYGPDKYGPVPNVLKKFQSWFHDLLLHNKMYPMAKKGELAERVAGAAANTMVTFHGGNLFAPVMKWLENSRKEITGFVNRHTGKPGEEDISNEKFKNVPQQTWGDIFKGRLAAWATVFTGFMLADAIAGKHKSGMFQFDRYEEWFGRWLAGFSKAGKDIANVPAHLPLTAAQDANKLYRFGKSIALDIYATSAAIIIWNAVSRGSAEKRKVQDEKSLEEQVKDIEKQAGIVPPASDAPAADTPVIVAPQEEPAAEKPTCKPCTIKRVKKEHASLSDKIAAERHLKDSSPQPGLSA